MIELRVSEPDPIVLEAEEQDQASLAVLEAFVSGGDIPAYTGSYNVTPTQSQQTLETNGKKMVRDVKVAPIPSQYIIPSGTKEITKSANGTTTENVSGYAEAEITVNVPASEVDSGTKQISIGANGTTGEDVTGYAAVQITTNVPNTYAAGDEGKVVSSGALVSQSSDTVTTNDTYDTTLINSLTVNVSGGGSGDQAEWNDVCFWDYDGTILYSYSAADFATLSSLPANPSHSGLTAQGWNWTLADAKTFVAANGFLDIGQLYVTSDGKTRVYLSLDSTKLNVKINLKCSVKNALTFDWGDGSSTETNSSTSDITYEHTYATAGDYVIKFGVSSGTVTLGTSSSLKGLIGLSGNYNGWWGTITKIECGTGVIIRDESLRCYHNIEAISMASDTSASGANFERMDCLKVLILPQAWSQSSSRSINYCGKLRAICFAKQSYTRTGNGSLRDNFSIRRLSAPIGYNGGIGHNVLNYSHSLEYMIIQDGVTSIDQYSIYAGWSLKKLTIPATVTSFNSNYPIADVGSLLELHLLPTSVPTLGNASNFLYRRRTDLKIYVPYSADHSILTAYQTASNWSSFSSLMVEENAP